MTKKAAQMKVSGDAANVTLDNRLCANWLRHGYKGPRKFTFKHFSDVMKKEAQSNETTSLTPVTLYRLTSGRLDKILSARAKFGDIAGIDDVAIQKLFHTAFAKDGMRLEWKLRSADFNRYPAEKAILLVPEAELLLQRMDAAAAREELSSTELLVRSSLGAQVATYKARIPGSTRMSYLRDAQGRLNQTAEARSVILERQAAATFTETVLSVRMESLAYFVEYNLHEEKDRGADLTAMARRVSNPRVLAAVTSVTTSLGDPRIPINFAEAAGFVGLIEGNNAKGLAHNKQAAAMLELTLQTANHTGPIKDFVPSWLRGYNPSTAKELKAAIDILEQIKE